MREARVALFQGDSMDKIILGPCRAGEAMCSPCARLEREDGDGGSDFDLISALEAHEAPVGKSACHCASVSHCVMGTPLPPPPPRAPPMPSVK